MYIKTEFEVLIIEASNKLAESELLLNTAINVFKDAESTRNAAEFMLITHQQNLQAYLNNHPSLVDVVEPHYPASTHILITDENVHDIKFGDVVVFGEYSEWHDRVVGRDCDTGIVAGVEYHVLGTDDHDDDFVLGLGVDGSTEWVLHGDSGNDDVVLATKNVLYKLIKENASD
jgi:hypothetical protein